MQKPVRANINEANSYNLLHGGNTKIPDKKVFMRASKTSKPVTP